MASYLLAALFGLVLGSFLNVVITRLPQKEQIWAGRSHCPSCHTLIAWYDNLPLFSYLRLRGRCRACRAPISWRYLMVELAGGLLALVLWSQFPCDNILIAYVPFSMALLALSVIDLERRLLPDAITLPGHRAWSGTGPGPPPYQFSGGSQWRRAGSLVTLQRGLDLPKTKRPAGVGRGGRKADGHDRGFFRSRLNPAGDLAQRRVGQPSWIGDGSSSRPMSAGSMAVPRHSIWPFSVSRGSHLSFGGRKPAQTAGMGLRQDFTTRTRSVA